MYRIITRLTCSLAVALLCCQSYAGTINFDPDFDDPGSDNRIRLDSGLLGTTNVTFGSVTLSGFLNELTDDVNDTGTISISGITVGDPVVPDPGTTSFFGTQSGELEIVDSNGALLLSGNIEPGFLQVGEFNGGFSSVITFTGGSLLEFIEDDGGLSLSLLELEQSESSSDFIATFTAEISANSLGEVPEPSTLLMFSPILIGLFARRRSGPCV